MKRVVLIAGAAAIVSGTVATAATAYAASSPSASPSVPVPHPRFDLGQPSQMLYGESVGNDDKGTIETHDYQNGQVTAVSGTSMTVRSSDGTSWTWTLGSGTTVRTKDETASASDIKTGDKVIVSGLRSGSTRNASLVADPPPDFGKLRERLKNLPKDFPRPPGDLHGPPAWVTP